MWLIFKNFRSSRIFKDKKSPAPKLGTGLKI